MKKLISLLTAFVLLLQVGTLGAFAATPSKTLFTAVTEVYGVYAVGDNHTELSVFSAKKMEHMLRDYNSTKFYTNTETEFKVTSVKYTLAKDKKSVSASAVYADKSEGEYLFKKDSKGIIYLEFENASGVAYKCPKTYTTVDMATKYVKSDKFKAILKLEAALVIKINQTLDDIQLIRDNFNDNDPISETNFLEGFYSGPGDAEYINIELCYDFDSLTYKNFNQTLDATLISGDDDYTIFGADIGIEGNLMSIIEDENNFMNLTTSDRSTITHITIVIDGETQYDKDVNFKLDLN